MFLKKTFRKFFIRDASYDLFWFMFGLIFLFTFAFITMPQWTFCLGFGVLTSAIFRYITTDALFYDDLKNLDNIKDRLNYILSKNIFTLFFLATFVFVFYFISNIGIKLLFTGVDNLEYKMVFSIIIYILATENIILTFNHKQVPSNKSGIKRNYNEDVEVGMKNFISMITSLIINVILAILLFKYNMNLNFYVGICYLLVSAFFFSINNRLGFRKLTRNK